MCFTSVSFSSVFVISDSFFVTSVLLGVAAVNVMVPFSSFLLRNSLFFSSVMLISI